VEQVALESLLSSSKARVRPKSSCAPFGNYLIQALRLLMISMPRLPPQGCQCAIRALPTRGLRVTYLLGTNALSDLMRAAQAIENWMAGLDRGDRVVTCTIARGEILFGIARLPAGRQRTELEDTGRQFLAVFRCEPVPERAATSTRLSSWLANSEASPWTKTTVVAATALALGATLVSRDRGFVGIDGLPVVALE